MARVARREINPAAPPLADYFIGWLIPPMRAGKMARKLGAALLDDAAEGFKGSVFLDAGGQLLGEGP